MLQITDKKLKGKMRHTERLNSEAAVAAAKTDEWLLPAQAGTLEAEGMERTWRFSQVTCWHQTLTMQAMHMIPKACSCTFMCNRS